MLVFPIQLPVCATAEQKGNCVIMEPFIIKIKTALTIIPEENMQEMECGLLLFLLSCTTKTSAPQEETRTLIAGRSVFT